MNNVPSIRYRWLLMVAGIFLLTGYGPTGLREGTVRFALVYVDAPRSHHDQSSSVFLTDEGTYSAMIIDDLFAIRPDLNPEERKMTDTLQVDDTWYDLMMNHLINVRLHRFTTGVPRIDSNYSWACVEFKATYLPLRSAAREGNLFYRTMKKGDTLRHIVITKVDTSSIRECRLDSARLAALQGDTAFLRRLLVVEKGR